ncbi:MAG: NTP transferase domain-containing protein [candidate division Zixibacteria bacterium]|nr:NTP transferase domain-containing protein [candidate division Zixibacteria bacterium]
MNNHIENTAAVVLAAGKGKRMKSDLPKVLHEIGGRPLVCHVADSLVELGLKRAVFVVGFKKEMVIEALSDYDYDFAVQDEQLGTGHAVMMARDKLAEFEGDILVLLGDVPFLRPRTVAGLLDEHRRRGAVATVLTADLPDPTGYGRIVRADSGLVKKIVEHKDATEKERRITEINSGTFVFNRKALFSGLDLIDNSNSQGEYYLTDLMEIFLSQGRITAAYKTDDYREVSGINSREQLEELKKAYNLN